MDFISLCRKIISIDSTPSAGNEEVALFAADLCRQAGLHVTMQEGDLGGKKQFNLIARPAAPAKGTEEIIFQTHLDTVPSGPMGNWTKTDNNPFEATIVGDHIYGLGTADVKLDFLCKLRALKDFTGQKMKKPFALVGTFGEEIGMHGANRLMEARAVNSKTAIIGEPSELQIVYANNGYMIMSFHIPFSPEEKDFREKHADGEVTATTQERIFHGKAAHSSTPHLGDNAILKMMDFLSKLPEGIAILAARGGNAENTVPADAFVEVDATRSFSNSVAVKLLKTMKELLILEKNFSRYNEPAFSPSHPTMNVGVLSTNDEELALKVSFRITPQISETEIRGWAEGLTKAVSKFGVEARTERLSKPALTPLESPLVTGAVEISKKLGLPAKPITKASGTECSVYRGYGVDCIVFGPGVSIGNSHTANEYNSLKQLEKAVLFYGEAAKRFCL